MVRTNQRELIALTIAAVVAVTYMVPLKLYKFVASNLNGNTAKSLDRGLATSVPENDPLAPEVAWVMSFPRSGGDYVIDIIHHIAHKGTATNYGNVMEESNGVQVRNTYPSVPVFTERVNGPFLFTNHMANPSNFIPTNTYCTGYCWDCYPGRYVGITRDAFLRGCLTGTRFSPASSNNGENGFGTTEEVTYDGNLVKKAVLVVRDPYKIVEERFLYSTHSYATDKEWLPMFATDVNGFNNFCAEAGAVMAVEEGLWYTSALYTASRSIKCHAEFYKIVQWYNLVFETMSFVGITPHVVYYEDLVESSTYASTAASLFGYLELAPVVNYETGKPSLAEEGPLGFFSTTDKSNIKPFIQTMASPATASVLNRYLANL